jgi:hypothetical protein
MEVIMSRTYRRRKGSAEYRAFGSLAEYTVEWVNIPRDGFYSMLTTIPMDPNTKEYKIKRSEYYRDKTHNFKEPGPSWFRNLFSTRPLRGKAKKELHKFMRSIPIYRTFYGNECYFLQVMNECYEPIIESKGKLPYWT